MSTTLTSILLVEGISDFHLVQHILYKHNILAERRKKNQSINNNTIYIEPMEGKDELSSFLKFYLAKSDVFRLGIILDADQSYDDTFQLCWGRIENSVSALGYSVDPLSTEDPPPKKMMYGRGIPKFISAWIMPNNQRNGALENFASRLIPENDRLWPIAEQTVEDLPEKRFQTKSNSRIHKAKLHTWLAWQEKPGKPFGTAVKANYLDAYAPLALDFVDWIRDLFHQPNQPSQP